ncbi:YheT family hydrolase [Azohydromonas sediminis]|uniref:YheT family hydrolase n=1 Tax=Azohydromonas sediminis TaxID=2259674 RepID=UPI000E65D275|nr:alpha/beta fold hydrolase [Azohydromonas sediminis]
MQYRAPLWLPGGHLQTIWPALFSRRHRGPAPAYRRERWTTPDGDFVDVDFLDAADAAAPLLVLFHGLEGSSRGAYALAFADWARDAGWHYAVPHFRGCSGELNLAPRAYHSGDFEEVGWMLARLRERHGRPLYAVGISLGGNALLRWAEEAGDGAAATAVAVAAVSSPVDLAAGGLAIGRGFNRLAYTPYFLRTMKPKALAKWAQHPGLFDREHVARARTLLEFDDAFTAPVHGFRDALDYWTRASAKPHLQRIRIPALVLNARNDPFIPARSLPAAHEVGRFVTLWQPAHGGHVGFASGPPPGHVLTLPEAVMGWMQAQR